MVSPGQRLSVSIEKPAAGGRMLARHDGQVVLVNGAIPGETVTVHVTRVAKGVIFADTVSVEVASPDRREPFTDPACGGTAFAHIDYPRQLAIKADIITDGLVRIGRLTPPLVEVRGSRPDGYRMRARVHRVGHRIGFFREGTHHVCGARATRQLLDATCDVLDDLATRLTQAGATGVREIEISENLDASQRALHLESADPLPADLGEVLADLPGVSGIMATAPAGPRQAPDTRLLFGDPYVFDELAVGEHRVRMRRHVQAFFQGNRFVLPSLVEHVTSLVPAGQRVLDLYAGVGLFAVTAAVAGGGSVTAVEGDPFAARDLEVNASLARRPLDVVHRSVEAWLEQRPAAPDVVILDPPRTGVSPQALPALVGLAAPRVIYVSCDIATMARDVRQFIAAGYRCERIDGFDLFPNTPHVETVAVLAR